MENNNIQNGHTSLLVSILSASIAWVDIQSIDLWIKIVSSIVTAVASFMAIRYYHYNTKRIKDELNKK
jgi:membrane protein implicated in regulation of membrane protease activity